jgi:hypothetical protein
MGLDVGLFEVIPDRREKLWRLRPAELSAYPDAGNGRGGLRVKNGLAWVLALLASTPALSAGAQPKALSFAPAGPWAMEYADDSCRLVRNFRNGDK